MSNGALDKTPSRSGSQKRRVSEQIKINCTPEQKAAIVAKAEAQGQSPSALALHALLAISLPRVRRPRVDQQGLAQLITELQRWRGELNKIGSNLNQLTKYANLGRTQLNMVEAALNELLPALDRDLMEMRTAVMRVVGLDPHRET